MAETSRLFAVEIPNSDPIWLTIRKPTRREFEDADLEYSLAFNRAMKRGLPSRQRQVKDLGTGGQLTQEHFNQLQKLRDIAAEREEKLRNTAKDHPEYSFVEQQHREAVRDWQSEQQIIEQMLSHTADAKAFDAQRIYLIVTTIEYATEDANGKPVNLDKRQANGKPRRVWDTVESFLEGDKAEFFPRCYYEYTMFSNNLPSNWELDAKLNAEPDAGEGATEQPAQADVASATPAAPVAPAEPAPAESAAPAAPAAPAPAAEDDDAPVPLSSVK